MGGHCSRSSLPRIEGSSKISPKRDLCAVGGQRFFPAKARQGILQRREQITKSGISDKKLGGVRTPHVRNKPSGVRPAQDWSLGNRKDRLIARKHDLGSPVVCLGVYRQDKVGEDAITNAETDAEWACE